MTLIAISFGTNRYSIISPLLHIFMGVSSSYIRVFFSIHERRALLRKCPKSLLSGWLSTPSHLGSPHALTLFEIIFSCLYMVVTAECKISYFDDINLHPSIFSKLSYLVGQGDDSLRMDAQPSNQDVTERMRPFGSLPTLLLKYI